jgi:RNA polymerase sigma-70 factor (ECF subfamily)
MSTIRVSEDRTATEHFRSFVSATYQDVRLYALRRVNPDAVDDVVAETFAIAWRRWLTPPPTDPRPWLFGIARNVVRNQQRGLRRRLRMLETLPDGRPTEDGAIRVEAGSQLLSAFSELGDNDKEVLRLVAWEGLQPLQIAEVLGCSPAAAATRLHRARARLAAALGEDDS